MNKLSDYLTLPSDNIFPLEMSDGSEVHLKCSYCKKGFCHCCYKKSDIHWLWIFLHTIKLVKHPNKTPYGYGR